MDMSDEDKVEIEKRREYSASSHHTAAMPSWQYDGSYFTKSSSMGLVSDGNPIGRSSSSLGSTADSLVPPIWDNPSNSQTLGYSDVNLQNVGSFSDNLVSTRGFLNSLRSGLDPGGWEASNATFKGGLFLPGVSTMLPRNPSQFPTDSAFIERAARLSCFNTGNIADMVNPFGIHQSAVNPYNRDGVTISLGLQEVFAGRAMRAISGGQPSKNEENDPALTSQDVLLTVEEGSKLDSQRKNEGFDDEAKQGESDEAETAGGEEEPSLMGPGTEPSSAKGQGSKKRKRVGQDSDTEQSQQQRGEAGKNNGGKKCSPPPTTNKNSGKNGKQIYQASDQPKEEYIHVRARRGQATNSHSLAERVRREKISERMKFLQDLVPGCSKVTGKAVMLDEIINYVQSLQRQVEFLSMKLATVNPRLDFNVENLLAKDPMFGTQAGPSSTLGFSPDMHMAYPPMHPPQQSFARPGFSPIGTSSSDALRNITSQLMGISAGYKEPASQLPNVWDDELHNVVQMGFNPAAPNPGNDEDTSRLPSGQTKVEL